MEKTFQERANEFCMPSSANMPYMLFGGVAEFGELFEKMVDAGQIVGDERVMRFIEVANEMGVLAKAIRKGEADYPMPMSSVHEDMEIAKEVGDIKWFVSGVCTVAGWKEEGVGDLVVNKLSIRKANNCIEGNGDGCKIGEGRSND